MALVCMKLRFYYRRQYFFLINKEITDSSKYIEENNVRWCGRETGVTRSYGPYLDWMVKRIHPEGWWDAETNNEQESYAKIQGQIILDQLIPVPAMERTGMIFQNH